MNIRKYLPARRIQLFYATALLGVTIMNFFVMGEEAKRIRSFKKVVKHQNIGYQFAGLDEFTKGMAYIGYVTDEDVTKNDAAHKLFAHAQFMLAPSILDLNNYNHEYILFVCTNENYAWEKIKKLNALPLRRNKYGMILARTLK
ncbi:MAG: hypothetical protein KBD53_06085 [Candidatus Omnitrophica bacterium]|nr:hypothetical protein [Candidatus Omnitrophota bacterium]